jgi:hypothetical protein
MMNRFVVLAIVATTFAAACGSKTPTTPSNSNQVKFTATLLPSNETPAITNADQSGRGTATVTMNLTKDATGAITAATADFSVDLSNFPAGTVITAAHIHQGAAGVSNGPLISMGLVSGEIVLVNGSQSGISKTGLTAGLSAATAQDIINNPASYYFNVHTQLNTGGAARGQLVKQ